jgi:hypothetical protein
MSDYEEMVWVRQTHTGYHVYICPACGRQIRIRLPEHPDGYGHRVVCEGDPRPIHRFPPPPETLDGMRAKVAAFLEERLKISPSKDRVLVGAIQGRLVYIDPSKVDPEGGEWMYAAYLWADGSIGHRVVQRLGKDLYYFPDGKIESFPDERVLFIGTVTSTASIELGGE